MYENIHNYAHDTPSPLEKTIEASMDTAQYTQDHETKIPVSPTLMQKIIDKLPTHKAPGPDKLTTEKFKNLPRKTIVQIYYIFKSCIQLSYFPLAWKIAKVHPVPKPGKSKNNINSYRPISLLSTLSKVLEKVIHIQLLKHLKNNNILILQQFGFREGHSCIQQLLRVAEYATLEINKNRLTQLLLLDIEKAFDTPYGTRP